MTLERVPAKAAFVREALASLDAVPQDSLASFLADERNLASTLHWIQTAVQALVDIGLSVAAARGLPTPRTSAEVLERLEAAGVLPAGAADRYRPLVGFRNRVVHLYERVDPEIVYRILVEDRDDLRGLLDVLLAASEQA